MAVLANQATQADFSINNITPEYLEDRANNIVPAHPFEDLSKEVIADAANEYQAMSEFFPYIQSAATYLVTRLALEMGRPVPSDLAATFPVGTFLVWDELGGHWKLMNKGIEALPSILDKSGFHSEMLRKDWHELTGKTMTGAPGQDTAMYLKALMDGLSSPDPVRRSAMMASFEVHANRMIGALWTSIAAAYGVEKDNLVYFRVHVGGDDPAEAYHVAMTTEMLALTVPKNARPRFFREFDSAYMLHAEWCAAIVGKEV